MPRVLDRVMTLMTMDTAGAMVKTAAVRMVLRIFPASMPISRPRRRALTRKYTDWARTPTTGIRASRNKMGWLTENSIETPPRKR